MHQRRYAKESTMLSFSQIAALLNFRRLLWLPRRQNPSKRLLLNACARQTPSAIIALGSALICAPSGAAPSGYAELVRRVAPSVVTVLVEEAPIGAGQRAAARATASDYDAMETVIRRLLSGPSGDQA